MVYNYKEGKKRIEDILTNEIEIVESTNKGIPSDDNFTFNNGYKSYVSAIFVDIRDSTTIFSKENNEEVAKMIRAFTSEIIEVLRADDNLREIGIRGDCVYAVYSTPKLTDIYDCYVKTAYVNTLINMLNKLLSKHNFDNIKAGIGLATALELVVKAGRKGADINSKVWIGKAVTKASKLSSLGDKNGEKRIVISGTAYLNIIAYFEKIKQDSSAVSDFKLWFQNKQNYSDSYYVGKVLITDFDNWITDGMLDD